MAYTIKELADLAGITTRALRYYDEIGLLIPTDIGPNGYRYYDQDSLLRLQQIMFFRELDVPLKEIQLFMNMPDFNLSTALEQHRRVLRMRAQRLTRLLDTIDRTLATVRGETMMTDKDYFEGFDETKYEEEARERWGDTPQYAESRKKWAGFSIEQKEAIKIEGGQITLQMVGQDPDCGPGDPEIQAAVGDYYRYLNQYFYTCDLQFLRNLSDMWVEDPRFAANYERIRPGGAAFVRDAVHIYCDRNQ